MRVNWRVVRALCKRDLKLYFSNPSGYVFITLFIFLSAAAAFWQDRFFLNNLANLDQLNTMFPYLLLFFAPAITMGVWADERKQGTDELLLTLPATDFEIVLGKYLSTLGIYTAAVVLSLSHLVVLFWLGNPDIGLMLSNYIGYWLIGAAFIAVGMLASLLSPNVTIAFIIGAIFCAIFVYTGALFSVLGQTAEDAASTLAVFESFGDFSRGTVSFAGLLYFLSITATMLYLNVVLLGRRHWPQQTEGPKQWMHELIRAVALVIAVIGFNIVVGRATLRADFTAEKLHSLSDETRQLLKEIPSDRPVLVQAYMSKDVPTVLVQTRANLYGFLKEIDRAAGDRVQVIIHDTEPFTDVALDAREKFGIVPAEVPEVGGRAQISQVFLGVAFTCGAEEEVVPFWDRGLSTEYEIVRNIRVVSGSERKKIGVVNTAVNVFGGFDFNTYATQPAWGIVEELRKQYEVVRIAAADSITEEVDALVIALPSSLPQEEMNNVLRLIEAGTPTLLLVDPVPVFNIGLAPNEQAGAQTNPFQRNQGPPPQPKGEINSFIASLGINWNKSQIIWDGYNPHPDLASLPPEIVFVGRGNENPNAINDAHTASAQLQEAVLLYPGTLNKATGTSLTFEPLLRTSQMSGSIDYSQVVQRSFFGTQLVQQGVPHYATATDYTVAAAVQGTTVAADGSTDKTINVIVVADLDFVSAQFFEIRRLGIENLNFDNISFFLNCIDVLVEDESFVALRKRRVRHRTLETVEARTRAFSERRANEEQEAEAEAQRALVDAQRRLNEKVAEVQQRADLDQQTKQIMARNLQEVENRRFDALKANIEADKEMKVQASREKMESQIRSIQSNIKTLAGLLPPIPVFVVGIMIFLRRQKREKEGAAAARRLRG